MKRGDGHERSESKWPPEIKSISAVSLATHDMARAVQFYRAPEHVNNFETATVGN